MQTPPFRRIVCLLATLLLLATLPTLSHAFWSQQRPQQQHVKSNVHDNNDQTSHDSFARDDFVSVEEMYTLQHATGTPTGTCHITEQRNALKAYDSKPDCFKDAARALQQGCKSIDIDEDEKTRYAIRLTTCEIATANMPIPQECHSLASAESDPDKQPTANDISRCVQSLGRVPQLWTSYSGYFREVKVMCLAVRYSLEHEQQRVLKETNRLETEQLKQLSALHSTITADVNSMLTLASVSQSMRHWNDSLERGISRAQEIDRLNQDSILLLWRFCAHLLDCCRVLRKAQRENAVEQEQEREYEYGVDDQCAERYLDTDSSEEEEEDLEMEEHVWQQYDDDTFEQRATARYNNPTSPSTPTPSTRKPKRQYQYHSTSIGHIPLTKPSMDMEMDMWERVAASWDLSLGTCVSSSSTSGDIY
ncbi:hypothetical protein K457DRAFT_122712 [Linnemannia elongata AG-77]|uniref:Karyogamy protein 5 n=1 Tax=Linnemannia elongata AG-77 TaxID=1314771 RepID=A0A197K5Q4_9FUNG|nr:hypothetical protein K457DRAFT_122712 [Linnemannia elongata AG-77]